MTRCVGFCPCLLARTDIEFIRISLFFFHVAEFKVHFFPKHTQYLTPKHFWRFGLSYLAIIPIYCVIINFFFYFSRSEIVQRGHFCLVWRLFSEGFSFAFLSTGELLPTQATRQHKIVDSGPNLVAWGNGQPLLSSPAV